MTLPVLTLVRYLTRTDCTWRPEDYDARNLTYAVKGKPFRGYSSIDVCGKSQRLDTTTAAQATTWCGRKIGQAWHLTGWPTNVHLVPMPSAGTVRSAQSSVRVTGAAHKLAHAIAAALGPQAVVSDVLSFTKAMRRAHDQDGTRDPWELLKHLDCARLPGTYRDLISGMARVVLVDDVLTSGGHLQAADAKILATCAVSVLGAVVVSKAEHIQDPGPLSPQIVSLPQLADPSAWEDPEPVPGHCLICDNPAIVEMATCSACGRVVDGVVNEEPVSVTREGDGTMIAYFAGYDDSLYAAICSVCGPAWPIDYVFNQHCSWHEHVLNKDD